MRKVLLHLSIVPAALIFLLAVWLINMGSAVYLIGRWLGREHDKYLRWFHENLCGGKCPHWGERDG